MSASIRDGIAASATLLALSLGTSCGEGSSTSTSAPAAGQAPTGTAAGAAPGGASAGTAGSVDAAGRTSALGGAGSSTNAGSPANLGGAATSGAAGAAEPGAGSVLRIYWIDVEGGASTIIAAPNGRTIVVDAGWAGDRDAARIANVLKDELHVQVIDHFITTHYHTDHIGGVPTLAGLVPISQFHDHGATLEPGRDFDNYVSAAGDKRVTQKPGDKLDLGELHLTFVTSATEVIDPPLPPGATNTLCDSSTSKSMTAGIENTESLGFVATFGQFQFVDLGDLTWNIEQTLMCPLNRLGTADVYQVSHHGQDISGSPQLVYALAPTVAIMNNGASKGGASATFELLKASPGLKDLWSLHHVTANDAEHNAVEDLTANLAGADEGYFIAAEVAANGSYTITNSRTGASRTYASH
ncbi:MAG: MBL fold metallo-hydrolase [Myxococcales bacterium]